MSYNFPQWLMFFYIYCFIGWCIESTIVSIQENRLVNRGFLRSPFLPLYGFGAIVILFVTLPAKENAFLIYLFGLIGCTILEYITAVIMESLFKMKYWDYSEFKFNYQGRICLTASFFWGVLSLFLTKVIHKPVETIVISFENNHKLIFVIILCIISVIIVSDTIYAVKTAFNVNAFLGRITKIKEELEQLKLELTEKIENSERTNKIKDRIAELKAEYSNSLSKLNFFNKQLIKAHPHARSNKFNDALQEVRKKLSEKKSSK